MANPISVFLRQSFAFMPKTFMKQSRGGMLLEGIFEWCGLHWAMHAEKIIALLFVNHGGDDAQMRPGIISKTLGTFLDLCMSPLRRCHANQSSPYRAGAHTQSRTSLPSRGQFGF